MLVNLLIANAYNSQLMIKKLPTLLEYHKRGILARFLFNELDKDHLIKNSPISPNFMLAKNTHCTV